MCLWGFLLEGGALSGFRIPLADARVSAFNNNTFKCKEESFKFAKGYSER